MCSIKIIKSNYEELLWSIGQAKVNFLFLTADLFHSKRDDFQHWSWSPRSIGDSDVGDMMMLMT